jgi:hypothetical protein
MVATRGAAGDVGPRSRDHAGPWDKDVPGASKGAGRAHRIIAGCGYTLRIDMNVRYLGIKALESLGMAAATTAQRRTARPSTHIYGLMKGDRERE